MNNIDIDIVELGYCAFKAAHPAGWETTSTIFGWEDIFAFNATMACVLRIAGRQGYEMGLYCSSQSAASATL